MGVSAWCSQNTSQLNPRVISRVLYGFARMGVTPTPIIQLFEREYGNKLGEFNEDVRV